MGHIPPARPEPLPAPRSDSEYENEYDDEMSKEDMYADMPLLIDPGDYHGPDWRSVCNRELYRRESRNMQTKSYLHRHWHREVNGADLSSPSMQQANTARRNARMAQQSGRSRRDVFDANSDSGSFQQRNTAWLHARLPEQDERNRRKAIDANSVTWSTYAQAGHLGYPIESDSQAAHGVNYTAE